MILVTQLDKDITITTSLIGSEQTMGIEQKEWACDRLVEACIWYGGRDKKKTTHGWRLDEWSGIHGLGATKRRGIEE